MVNSVSRHSLRLLSLPLLGIAIFVIYYYFYYSIQPMGPSLKNPQQLWERWWRERTGEREQNLTLATLGVLSSRDAQGWFPRDCNQTRNLRQASFATAAGNLSVYIYDSEEQDDTFTKQALLGSKFFEQQEMTQFLHLSRDLPVIDVGANIGLVTLQAALQGRQVVAVEPIPENALRLCRAVLDFGHAGLVRVIQNAVSSSEGAVALAMDRPLGRARYRVSRSRQWGYGSIQVFAMKLDRLLGLLPFRRAALKIDVESHEGHVLAGAERLFQEVDIPLLWIEWEHLVLLTDHGAAFVVQFLRRQGMAPHNLMTGQPLALEGFLHWPRSVLWRKEGRDRAG